MKQPSEEYLRGFLSGLSEAAGAVGLMAIGADSEDRPVIIRVEKFLNKKTNSEATAIRALYGYNV